MKTYWKSIFRMFRSNVVRLMTISLIVAVGVSLITSLCAVPEHMRTAIAETVPSAETILAGVIADRVELIGFIFPLFFMAVSVLTALMTVTRLVEEQRPVIACLKTLGFSNFAVVARYIIFAFVCAVFGCVLGLLIGKYAVLPMLYDAVTMRHNLADIPGGLYITHGFIWSAAITAAVVLTALAVTALRCRDKPAVLLRAKSPKAGKKIFLEYLPFLWGRLKFKYKSSVRNIIRYKGRLIMTVLAVIGSTMMLFCGVGMLGSVSGMRGHGDPDAIVDSLVPVAVMLTCFAAILSVLVLFNLTNINIEERRREIATLKVLGYGHMETSGYIFREIILMSLFGIAVGLPIGYAFLGFIFDYVGFSSLSYVKWYVWVITAAAAYLSVIVTDFILFWKIKRISMSLSLKTVD